MSWHYYCPIASKGPGNKDPFTEFQKLLCDTILAPLVFKTADKRSKEVGGGRMLTEVNIQSSTTPMKSNYTSSNYASCKKISVRLKLAWHPLPRFKRYGRHERYNESGWWTLLFLDLLGQQCSLVWCWLIQLQLREKTWSQHRKGFSKTISASHYWNTN